MRRFSVVFTAAVLAACSSAPPTTAPAPVSAPAVVLREAPHDWHLLDATADNLPGISVIRARRELLAGKQPQRTVLVAIIDNGIDTAHVDLKGSLWTNPREVPGNSRDDDGNGYVDDVHGWDFIGGRDGRNVNQDTFEVTRLYVRCGGGGPVPDSLPAADRQQCPVIASQYHKKADEAEQTLEKIREFQNIFAHIDPLLRQATNSDSVTPDKVEALRSTQPEIQQARSIYLQLSGAGITPAMLVDAKKEYESQLQYSLNTKFNPRAIVGDNPANVAERNYGNADVMGPGPKHGTHVAGIIKGIAPTVRIMAVRAVPDGDERDKDIANAIRYAADNGANVINMSFGKAFSPQKSAVDEAVRYAESKGVLLVHAAGNDAEDAGTNTSYPTPFFGSGGRAGSWIEVGATSWKRADSLVASFSNYGKGQVDVFAPGVDIWSTIPGNAHAIESGTSMASPVVAGLAALILSYYPSLSAADVKRIILDSSTRYPTLNVIRPGEEDGERVAFSSLSTTGGIVNAYAALKLAEQASKLHP